MANEYEIKKQICDIGKRIYDRGMVAANDGNISVKLNDNEFLCTPTGVSKGFMTPEYICKVDAKFSRKEPQPDEHASLTRMLVITPLSIQIAFMSCPPISRINVASLTYFCTALACATVSTVWYSAWNALAKSCSPYPVVPAAMISNLAPAFL